ncbi:cyclophilin-like fold protein [Micromonospora sp. MS34]|uniref:cyclophilin-like fold protein n=1 Tax=Micromonospora sp. MS34 TaxID=3385971 RepID=UPI00399FF18F
MQIHLAVGGTVIPATLENSQASRDFAALLPLTLTLTDYAGTEKVSNLPTRLSTASSPEGVDPDIGDITYYAPWGNLAIFYRDFGYARGLVKLGHIDADINTFTRAEGGLTVTITSAG